MLIFLITVGAKRSRGNRRVQALVYLIPNLFVSLLPGSKKKGKSVWGEGLLVGGLGGDAAALNPALSEEAIVGPRCERSGISFRVTFPPRQSLFRSARHPYWIVTVFIIQSLLPVGPPPPPRLEDAGRELY